MGHVKHTIDQITNNVGSNTRSDLSPPLILHYNPDWNVLSGMSCLECPRSQQFVYSKSRHSNEVQLTSVKLEHPLTIIT